MIERFVPGYPILRRELIALLRLRRAFWLLVAVVAIVSIVPLATWPNLGEERLVGYRAQAAFLTVTVLELALALLIIPAFTAGAISSEREADTWDSLYTTLLPPWSIVVAKVLSSAGYVLVLLVAAAPILSLLYLLGGVDFRTVIVSQLVIFAAVLASGLVCLTTSMRSRSTAQAVVRGIVWILFWNGGLALLLLLGAFLLVEVLEIGTSSFYYSGFVLLAGLSPFATLAAGVGQPMALAGSVYSPWSIYFVYAGALALLHLAILLVRARVPDSGPGRGRRSHARRMRRPRFTRFTRLVLRVADSSKLPPGGAVLAKEVRSEFFGRLWFRRTLFWVPLAIFLALLGLGHHLGSDLGDRLFGPALICLTLTIVLVPAIAASGVTRERERGTLDFLRTSLLTIPEIVWGKLYAALYGCAGLVAALGVTAVAGLALWGLDGSRGRAPAFLALAQVAVPILAAFVFTAALGTLASVLGRRSLTALILAYGTLLAVHVFGPFLNEVTGLDDDEWFVYHPYYVVAGLVDYRQDAARELGAFAVIYVVATLGVLAAAGLAASRRLARDD